jgi:hypothetical protein
MKTVRNSVEPFSFFLLPFSFFFEREKKKYVLAGRKKEKGRRKNTPLILLVFHYAHSSIKILTSRIGAGGVARFGKSRYVAA